MKIVTSDFGIVEVKPKRLFEHNGIRYAIVSVPYKYLNNNETHYIDKCVHYLTGWQIPVYNIHHKATIKKYIEASKQVLDNILSYLGEDAFNKEINSKEVLNK